MVRLHLLAALSFGLAFSASAPAAASLVSTAQPSVVIFDDGKSAVQVLDSPPATREYACGNGETLLFQKLGSNVDAKENGQTVALFKCLPGRVHSEEVKTSEMLEILRGIESALKVEADGRVNNVAGLEKALASLDAEIAALKKAK
jgi:hypothetical protein